MPPIIPKNLNELPHLDLSCNKLNGEISTFLSHILGILGLYVQFKIPPDLCNLVQLEYFDFSMNMLGGHIPEKNIDLCGKIMGLDYQVLTFSKLALFGTVVGSVLAIAIIVSMLWWIQRGNRQQHLSINLAMFEPSLGKLTYDQIVAGTNKFYEKNVIRGDDFGIAFKAKHCIIACGTARGITFLHHRFQPHIIHRDINASNILLNEDFEVKVSDFGLVRLISDCESHTSTDVAGTIGYILLAGDIYSFSVVLLELVIRKQPTGPEFKDKNGGNLVDWVLDSTILNAYSKPSMLKMLQIVVGCIFDNPTTRPTMLRVQEFLEKYHTGENFGRY
ncbi:Leucine-rich repeat receptor protein kinase EMS1 [Citrus sinensis]|nr:Leucine-rich repeat receptor protein kinase EMS1 [Citrus sinensis]